MVNETDRTIFTIDEEASRNDVAQVGNTKADFRITVEDMEGADRISVPDRPETVIETLDQHRMKRASLIGPFAFIVVGSIVISLTFLIRDLIHLIKLHRIMAVPVGTGIAMILVGLCWIIFREINTTYRRRNADSLRRRFHMLISENSHWSEAAEVARNWSNGVIGSQRSLVQKLNDSMEPHYRADRFLLAFEKEIIGEMDKRAILAIRRASRDTFLLTTLSPTKIIESATFVFRALTLIREVSISYGVNPGRIGQLRLLRQALKNVAIISLSDIILTDAFRAGVRAVGHVTKAVGVGAVAFVDPSGTTSKAVDTALSSTAAVFTEVAGDVAKDVAIGLVSARRMALFGRLVLSTCRPLELNEESLKKLNIELTESLKKLRMNKDVSAETV